MTCFNVKSLIALAIVVLNVLNTITLPQTIEPDSSFNNTWVLKSYYERLSKNSSVCKAMNDSDFEIRIIRFNSKENVLNIGSLIEGNRESFIVRKENELYIPASAFFKNPFTLSLVKRNSQVFLALYEIKTSNSDSVFYVSLPNKYSTNEGFEHFINDKSFTGEYNLLGRKLKFYTDGRCEGFGDFDEYVVHNFTLTNFDIVSFQKKERNNAAGRTLEKIVNHKSYHWKIIGRDILLYNLSDETPVAEVKTLFAKLKKLD